MILVKKYLNSIHNEILLTDQEIEDKILDVFTGDDVQGDFISQFSWD
jgi:hypothetical protein